jgi:hypothetical protein
MHAVWKCLEVPGRRRVADRLGLPGKLGVTGRVGVPGIQRGLPGKLGVTGRWDYLAE